MDYLPIFADLKRRPCLVVGGGNSAWRKTRMLLKAGADVGVIASKLNTDFEEAIAAGQVRHIGEEFTPSDLDGIF